MKTTGYFIKKIMQKNPKNTQLIFVILEKKKKQKTAYYCYFRGK